MRFGFVGSIGLEMIGFDGHRFPWLYSIILLRVLSPHIYGRYECIVAGIANCDWHAAFRPVYFTFARAGCISMRFDKMHKAGG